MECPVCKERNIDATHTINGICYCSIECLRVGEIQTLKNRISELLEANSIIIQSLIKLGFDLKDWVK